MRRFVVEQVLVPALRALQKPSEQLWLGATLATVLVVFIGPGGKSAGSHQATSAPGSYQRSALSVPHSSNKPFATIQEKAPTSKTPNQPAVAIRPLDSIRLPEETAPVKKDDFGVIH